jgi:hypothetical protein
MASETLISIVKILSWPVVVLVFGIAVLIVCKEQIRSLIERLRKVSKDTIQFGDSPIDRPSQEAPPETRSEPATRVEQPEDQTINWNKSGHLFWVGHDLMWTIDVLLRSASRDTIVHGLRQSLHHARSLGFINTPIESRLARLKADAESSLEQDWTPPQRNNYANELRAIVGYIASLATANQPDFESSPRE